MKTTDSHEIRDPIHIFVRLDSHEREVLNSRPFQRLRHIHQLAMTYLVYPGATHRRFEHSLGVMELAGRVFDIVTSNVTDEIKAALPPLMNPGELAYWRRVLRMAALCHDLGHLPFSHAAEKQLLPAGWDHERLTHELILSNEMKVIWNRMTPPLRADDVVKLAIGPKKIKDPSHLQFSDWEAILSEIIVGDAFGVDRMDYLLRDSHHVGVAYGRFDHYRLIDTLRILPAPPSGKSGSSQEPALGIEEGGIQSAEALMLARYFMYSQVYFHPVRRIYDIHLMDFLKEWLDDGAFPVEVSQHLRMTDNEVTAGILQAAFEKEGTPGHKHARRIVRREHFKVVYERNPGDLRVNPEAGGAIFNALAAEFGAENFRRDRYHQESGATDFPVRLRSGELVSSLDRSTTLARVPVVSVDYVFADRSTVDKADKWLATHRAHIIEPKAEGMSNG
jgi:HD superfamily phosphohydrolase